MFLDPSVACKGALAGPAEEDYVIDLGFGHFDLHARRPAWHPGDCETPGLRLLYKQTFDCSGRYVAFDHVAGHFSGMTRRQVLRHPQNGL